LQIIEYLVDVKKFRPPWYILTNPYSGWFRAGVMETKIQTQSATSNFSFLEPYEPLLADLGRDAERYFAEDSALCLIKLRQFADLLARRVALRLAVATHSSAPLLHILNCLKNRGVAKQVLDIFHAIQRKEDLRNNDELAVHEQAVRHLKMAMLLGEWYVRVVTEDQTFDAPSFAAPPDPHQVLQELQEQLGELAKRVSNSKPVKESTKQETTILQKRVHAFRAVAYQEQLDDKNRKSRRQPARPDHAIAITIMPEPVEVIPSDRDVANQYLNLDQSDTRNLVDEQLRIRGWEADSTALSFASGAIPVTGRNMAIAGWPTETGFADYALFIGKKCIGVVEAKESHQNLCSAIDEAKKNATEFRVIRGAEDTSLPTSEYKVPFLFATNGRSFLGEIEQESGVWFLDARKSTNLKRALVDWPTPTGLIGLLELDQDRADRTLKSRPLEFGFPIRTYQRKAIEAVEGALAQNYRQMLLAMAPCTGKTKVATGLLYRLLSARRFRNACYVASSEHLAEQVLDEFRTTRVMYGRALSEMFGVEKLEHCDLDAKPKVLVCTIEDLFERVLRTYEPSEILPVDKFDLMVLDECHWEAQSDYLLNYQQILKHFDAVKIALTATPVLETVDIFGKPIFNYSYRRAVLEGVLLDHEPPIEINTPTKQDASLNQAGRKAREGTTFNDINPQYVSNDSGLDVEAFNSSLTSLEFNKAVAEELTRHIDPSQPGTTLVYAASPEHAGILCEQLRNAFSQAFVEMGASAIQVVASEQGNLRNASPANNNGLFPKIAVTADLRVDGADIPEILNLVFARRVNSRISFEQMLGRAALTCPSVGKESFRIFDAVGIYKHMSANMLMKPITLDPSSTMTQLFEQLKRLTGQPQRYLVYEQIIVQLRRRIKDLGHEVTHKYFEEAGESPEATINRFLNTTSIDAADWLRDKPNLGSILDQRPDRLSALSVPSESKTDLASRGPLWPVGIRMMLQSVLGHLS
jgi:type I restriction enzyme, R subunit